MTLTKLPPEPNCKFWQCPEPAKQTADTGICAGEQGGRTHEGLKAAAAHLLGVGLCSHGLLPLHALLAQQDFRPAASLHRLFFFKGLPGRKTRVTSHRAWGWGACWAAHSCQRAVQEAPECGRPGQEQGAPHTEDSAHARHQRSPSLSA